MNKINHRSAVNRNNMGHYNRLDQAIDHAMNGQTDITPIIGRCIIDEREPSHTPLRDRVEGSSGSSGIRVRVYSRMEDGPGYLGMAMSRDTMLALIELGYGDADQIQVKGRIDGEPIDAIIDEHEFAEFKQVVNTIEDLRQAVA